MFSKRILICHEAKLRFWGNTRKTKSFNIMSISIKHVFLSFVPYNSHAFLLILQRKERENIICMNQTEEDNENWKIEVLSTHNNCELKKHLHDYFQIVWVKKGQGQYTVNYESKEISDNSLLFIAPNICYSVHLCGEIDIVNITFARSFLENLCPRMEALVKYDLFCANATSAIVTVNCQVADKLNHILEAMMEEQECRTYPISKMLRIGSLFTLFIIEIKRHLIASLPINKPSYAYSMALNFRKALKENVCNTHHVKDYADLLGISQASLYRYVTATFGKSPLEVIHEELVARAKHLIISSSLTEKEIAEKLGICDAMHFAKIFKTVTGESPISFRESDSD